MSNEISCFKKSPSLKIYICVWVMTQILAACLNQLNHLLKISSPTQLNSTTNSLSCNSRSHSSSSELGILSPCTTKVSVYCHLSFFKDEFSYEAEEESAVPSTTVTAPAPKWIVLTGIETDRPKGFDASGVETGYFAPINREMLLAPQR